LIYGYAGSKSGFVHGQTLHDSQDIAERTGKPVEFARRRHVALAELIQEPVEFGSVAAAAGGFLNDKSVHSLRSSAPQLARPVS